MMKKALIFTLAVLVVLLAGCGVIYLHTDSEHDVQVLRERFLEWKNRNACKLNGKY